MDRNGSSTEATSFFQTKNVSIPCSQYSLDTGDGIESNEVQRILTPEELLEYSLQKEAVYLGVMQLPEKQAKRIYAYYYLNMTIPEIAQSEGVSKSRISESISRGLRNLKTILGYLEK